VCVRTFRGVEGDDASGLGEDERLTMEPQREDVKGVVDLVRSIVLQHLLHDRVRY
jgi:hypothetical protein